MTSIASIYSTICRMLLGLQHMNGSPKIFTALAVVALTLIALQAHGTPNENTPLNDLDATPSSMNWWQAGVLGAVEGVTEYLPVSSTGHLLMLQELMGIGTESDRARTAANAHAVCIQFGAIVAVLGLYRSRVRQVAVGWAGRLGVGSEDKDGFRLGLHLILAFLPAAVFGLLFDDIIESYLFGPRSIVAAWMAGGLAILGVSYWQEKQDEEAPTLEVEQMTPGIALGIGFIQCVAMWPGTSRSLVTIVGGVILGLSFAYAVEFSFLLGVITLSAATVYKAKIAGPIMLDTYGWMPMIVGSISAWIFAVLAVRWMVIYVQTRGMAIFGYYRVALACIVAAWLLFK